MDKYLNDLYNSLSFLNKKEKDKVINKYKNIINSRLKNGDKIDDIISDLGFKEDILKEVCDEYNLDYNYCFNQSIFDKNVTNLSNKISNFIKELILVVRKLYLGNSIENFIQTIIRIVIFILFALIVKLPFILFDELFKFINNYLFYPMNSIFNYFSNITLSLIYMFICITILIKIFGYNDIKEKKKNDIKIEDINKEYKWLNIIIRFLIYFLLLIPLGILSVLTLILFVFSIYIFIDGINIIGLPILLFGLFFILVLSFLLIKDSLNNKKKNYLLLFLISIFIFISGIVITFYNIYKFDKTSNLDKSYAKTITENLDLELKNSNINLLINKGNYEIVEDNNLDDSKVKLELTYYDDYVDVLISQEIIDNTNYLSINSIKDEQIKLDKLINILYKDLKNGYLFNYSNTDNIYVKIYCNNNVKKIIESNK